MEALQAQIEQPQANLEAQQEANQTYNNCSSNKTLLYL